MRLLMIKLWACLGLHYLDLDLLHPPCSPSPLRRTFIHHFGRTVSHHATHELERKAAAAAAGPAGAAAFKLLMRFKLFLLTGALLTLISDIIRDSFALIRSSPRTMRVCAWAVRAGLSYKRLRASHTDITTDAYIEELGALHSVWAKALAHVCRANGGLYVKFGQFAVAFGAVPREYRMVLAQLEDKARPRPFKTIRKVLASELHLSASQPLVGEQGSGACFLEFEEEATAAASLAQVHRARLSSGEEVAVKLQYPGLRSAVRTDLRIMKGLCRVAKAVFPDFSLAWLCDEMEAKLKEELNFRNEIQNAMKLHEILSGRKLEASVPHIYEHLSTPRMIVMEWIEGVKLTDAEELRRQGINPLAVGRAFIKLFAELIFLHGYVHGDPHPGNVMIRARGKRCWLHRLFRGSRQQFDIVLLDHGTYLTISPELREQFCQLWCSFVTGDEGVQAEMSVAVAGKRFEKFLPAMLTQPVTNRNEEVAIQKQYGIKGFGQMTSLLSLIPRDMMELLRINTVIRSSSTLLGIKMGERKRIFAWYARRGMPHSGNRGAHVHHTSRNLVYRARLLLTLTAWTCWCRAVAVLRCPWERLRAVCGRRRAVQAA